VNTKVTTSPAEAPRPSIWQPDTWLAVLASGTSHPFTQTSQPASRRRHGLTMATNRAD
jgi:hypothetical protein